MKGLFNMQMFTHTSVKHIIGKATETELQAHVDEFKEHHEPQKIADIMTLATYIALREGFTFDTICSLIQQRVKELEEYILKNPADACDRHGHILAC
jgi:predicted house-cleaning noncanonical NTP pyrophosphatase (MazG superfamily)